MIDAFGVDVVSKALGPNAIAGLGSSATKAGKKIFTNPEANYAADRLAANTAGRSGNVAAGRAARAQSRSGQVDTQAAKPKEYVGSTKYGQAGNYKNLSPQLAYKARAAGIQERAVSPSTTMGRRKPLFTRNQKIVTGTAVVGGGGVLTASSASSKRKQQGTYMSKSWEGIKMHDAFGVERSDISKGMLAMGAKSIRMGSPVKAASAATTGYKRGMASGAGTLSSIGRGFKGAVKSSPGTVAATGGLAGGGAAFGLGRMSKGFSPAQLEVMTRAGGSFANRANAAKAGKSQIIPRDGQYRNVRVGIDRAGGAVQRERSLSQFPRVARPQPRSPGFSGIVNQPTQATRGSRFAQARANGQRVVLNQNSDAAWKLNRAKASGATFGANNPANRVAKPKRSTASAKSRVRAKLGMKSY